MPAKKKKSISVNSRKRSSSTLRDDLAKAVLTGIYSNMGEARRFVIEAYGEAMPLLEGFVRLSYAQADEAIRLRSL